MNKKHLARFSFISLALIGCVGWVQAPRAHNVAPYQIAQSQLNIEGSLIEAINHDREIRGLSAFGVDPILIRAARAHSREMKTENYFSHVSDAYGQENAEKRYSVALGKEPSNGVLIGENLFWMHDPGFDVSDQEIAQMAEEAFMKSDEHRSSILEANFTKVGVGIIKKINADQSSDFWVTVDFLGNRKT